MSPFYTMQDDAALRDAAASAVEHARALGADGASAHARAGGGVRIVVRDGVAETAVRDGYQSLAVTLFRDGRSGSASTAALDPAAIRRAADEAFAIAGHVRPDPTAGLADPDTLAMQGLAPELLAPSGKDAAALLDLALEGETLALAQPVPRGVSLRISESGAASSDLRSALATSAGFCRSTASSSHGRWIMALAQGVDGAVQDYDETSDRRFDRLAEPQVVAARAVERAAAQLGSRAIASRRAAVLFDARVASAIVGDLVAALSGGAQYRRSSWLPDAIGRTVAGDHVDLVEDPFEPFGMASGAYDAEGVAGSTRRVIDGGVVRGYFLDTYTARRLGRRSTGNAGGPWNLRLTSRDAGGSAAIMRARVDTGLLVTRLLGGATDPVTGTWTRAVAGFWIERGEIVHPVADVTVAGTMTAMLAGLIAIGDDVHRAGSIRSGSILIDDMQIGGAA